jgi:hypothetical protein
MSKFLYKETDNKLLCATRWGNTSQIFKDVADLKLPVTEVATKALNC